jgi:copper(I)-binding protein
MKRWLGLALALCATQVWAGGLQIREGFIRELPPGQSTSAAYMDLLNSGDRPIAIIGANSDSAASAQLHNHQHSNGMMQMVPVNRLEIPAHGHVLLAPGGYHLMLINLKHSLRVGDQVGITLFDEEGKFYPVKIPVVKVVGADSSKP